MGQTKITGRCDGLMRKNGEHNVVELVYVRSCRHSRKLTNMRRKASACIGLHVAMVPESYQHVRIARRWPDLLW
jgi:hypothetical protein